MDIYAFTNQKGGVGKTTVTLGIGAALARSGRKVLLIDLDPQASATMVLGVDIDDRCTVADAMLEPERFRLTQAIVETSWGFDLAPAETALASREARRSTADEFVLRDQLEQVGEYDLVLIDCAPSLGVLTLNALAAASHLVLVTEPSFLALQGIEELLRTRDLVATHYNPRLALAGVIINRVERTVEHRDGLAEIEAYFGEGLVWLPHLPKRTALQEGARRGVVLDELGTRAGREVSEVFARLAEKVGGSRVRG
jgi:chromosome partitioning protein